MNEEVSFTTQELFEIQQFADKPIGMIDIMPLLISTKLKGREKDKLNIEMELVDSDRHVCHSTKPITSTVSIVSEDDQNKYYQIINHEGYSYMLRIVGQNSDSDQPAFFSKTALDIIQCHGFFFVVLSNNSFECVTKDGTITFPPILIDGGICLMNTYENRYLLCLSNYQVFYVWEIANSINSILTVEFYGQLDEVTDISMTRELKDDSVSPIIITNDQKYRWSSSRNSWLKCNATFQRIFGEYTIIETIEDLTVALNEAIHDCDVKNFSKCFIGILKDKLDNYPFSEASSFMEMLLLPDIIFEKESLKELIYRSFEMIYDYGKDEKEWTKLREIFENKYNMLE